MRIRNRITALQPSFAPAHVAQPSVVTPTVTTSIAAPFPRTTRPATVVPIAHRTPAWRALHGILPQSAASTSGTPSSALDAIAEHVTKASMGETLQVLCKDPILGPREAGSPAYLLSAKWVAEQLESAGLEPLGDVVDGARTFLQAFEWDERYARVTSRSANVVAVLPGTSPEPRKCVLLSAHLDNLSAAQKQGVEQSQGIDMSSYEGANDNTASVAIALDTARALARTGPFEHDVIVLISSAEEDFLKGALAFSKDPPVPLSNIIANVNLEMPGDGRTEDVFVYGGHRKPQLQTNPLYQRAMALAQTQPVPLKDGLDVDAGNGWYARQDGAVFHGAGIPTVLLQGGGAHGHYHTDHDRVENLNMDKVEVLGRHCCRLVADLALDVAPRERQGAPGVPAGDLSKYVEPLAKLEREGRPPRTQPHPESEG